MKKIYLVRHGETAGNVGTILQSPVTPLNERGREQAQIVAKRCARLPVEALISSTMKRAHDTADIIGKHIKKTVELSDLFIERRRPSALFDRSANDAQAKKLEKEWRDSFTTNGQKILDAESFDEVRERCKRAFAYIDAREERNILIVTHGFFLQMLLGYVMFEDALSPREFKLISDAFHTNNSGITIFQRDQYDAYAEHRWYVRVWNDHAHLG